MDFFGDASQEISQEFGPCQEKNLKPSGLVTMLEKVLVSMPCGSFKEMLSDY